MRRSVWILAMCGFAGLSFQEVQAQEKFGQANPFEKTKPARSMFFSPKESAEPASESKTPARFVRTEESAPTEAPKNFYSELFGSEAEAAPTSGESAEVKQATFEQKSDEPAADTIQQVRGERSPFQSNRSFPRTNAPAQQVPVAGGARLTEPVPTEAPRSANPFAPKAPPAAQEDAPAPAPEARGSVSFSNAPVARPAQTAPVAEAVKNAGPQNPSVSIEWIKKSDINVGQECHCELVVKNTSSCTASNVEIEAFFPKNIRLINASPEPTPGSESLLWRIAELPTAESKTFEVTFIPLERGGIATRADVRFSASATGDFTVAEPLIALKIEGPNEVMIGDPASQTVYVSNPGTGIATNVQVEALIPEGLEHARGKRLLMDLGTLNPGESRPVRLALAANTGGQQVLQVQARADGGLVQTNSAEVAVIAPKVLAGVDGPGLRYVGRHAVYTLKVANDGAAPTDNVRVMHKIPEGMSFISADRGAQYDATTRILSWFVGRLAEGQTAELKVTLNSEKIGEFTQFVRATSEHGSVSDAQVTTAVEGTSSLAVEVRDLDDPVEVGTEAVYEIKVKNEGSAAAKNVGLACELAPGMNFISAEGPAEFIAENGVVLFRTLGELGPGQVSTYKVHVSTSAAASLRFRARLSSESIAEPLTTEELTKFYGE